MAGPSAACRVVSFARCPVTSQIMRLPLPQLSLRPSIHSARGVEHLVRRRSPRTRPLTTCTQPSRRCHNQPAPCKSSRWFGTTSALQQQGTSSEDMATVTLQELVKRGTEEDLNEVVTRIDRWLDTAANQLEEADLQALRSEEVWGLYTQACVRTRSEGSVANLVKLLRDKDAKRSALLISSAESPSSTLGEQVEDAPPSRSALNIGSLVTALFSRSGRTARIVDSIRNRSPQDVHQLNEQVLATSSSPRTSFWKSAASKPTLPLGGTTGSAAGNVDAEPIRVIVEEYKGDWFMRLLRFLGVTAVYSFIMLAFLSLIMNSSGILKATAAGGSPTEFQPQSQATVTFNDVHGCDEAKDELQEVVEFLKDPSRFARLGGRLPRGVLLTGPPGTGKTLLARAVAGEAGVQFFIASGSEFDEMYVGVGARRIRELFAAARKSAPAIIFIDELDAIGSKRSPKDMHYIKQTLNQLLVELDGFQQHEGVILMAATNFPQSLDKALTRPGRFDRHVAVPLPDARGRIQILKHHVKTISVDEDADLSIIARGTPGFSGAEIQNLVNQAAVKASREGASIVTAQHFDWARDRIMMGAEMKSYITTPENKRTTAYHEAGHALVGLYTKGAMPLHKVTCLRRGHALGLTHFLPELDKESKTYTEYRANLDVAMGGRAAEQLIYGEENVTSGSTSDIDNATRIATSMIRQMGFSQSLGPRAYREDEQLSSQTLTAIEVEVKELIENAQRRALQILTQHRIELDRLAQALIEYETLDAEEAKIVIRGGRLPNRAL